MKAQLISKFGTRNIWPLTEDKEFLVDPYPHFHEIREEDSIHQSEQTGDFVIYGHQELDAIASTPKMGRDMRLWNHSLNWDAPEQRESKSINYRLFSEFQPQMITSNPPDHTRMQAIFSPAFLPSSVKKMEETIRHEAQRFLKDLPDEGVIDLVRDYAEPLPLRIIRGLFDIPESMDADVRRWSDSLITIGDIDLTNEQKEEALSALMDFKGYLREFVAHRKQNPGSGLIDHVIQASGEGGTLSENEMITNLVSMIVAGNKTTTPLIGNGILLLLTNEDQLRKIRNDEALLPKAVDEFLRYEAGGNMILRIAIEDTDVFGRTIPKGSLCIGMIGAVNRDPRVFDRPDELFVDRHPNPHMTFGRGIHHCTGAPLARLEGKVAFSEFLNHYSRLSLGGQYRWSLERFSVRALETLPVEVAI